MSKGQGYNSTKHGLSGADAPPGNSGMEFYF